MAASGFRNEESRKAEIARRLKADNRYQAIEKELTRVRGESVELEAKLELARYEHRSAVCLLNLLASAIQGGRQDVEQAILGQTANTNGHKANGKKDNGLVEMAVEVLGAMPGKNQGTIKAVCRTTEGEEITVYAKDEVGRKLAKSIGEVVNLKARKMEDSGNWFAVVVK